ncbi:hypothetical protein PBOR_14455 [Paenibacillus borealis]|uniref:DinB-like domain-containing protein n=2 Tax=Paenibacillus borealis TaxID=160799 RepID=A0A089LD39_PAEBO|nr:hypothetical protein PBOR_14455 [Paenibacillus borealis]
MSEIILECMRRLDQSLGYVELALAKLTEEKVWLRPRPKMNAIGNLCLHVAGSEYQHLVSGIGGRAADRDRPSEFLTRGGIPPEGLLGMMREVREESWSVIRGLTEGDLQRVVAVHYPESSGMEGYSWSIQKILIGAAEHYAYHTGQIVFAAKLLQEEEIHLLNWQHYD